MPVSRHARPEPPPSATAADTAPPPAGLSGVVASSAGTTRWLRAAFLGLVFLVAAGVQIWHTYRTHQIDHAIALARTEHECLLRYAAGYEHQIRGLLLPDSTDRMPRKHVAAR